MSFKIIREEKIFFPLVHCTTKKLRKVSCLKYSEFQGKGVPPPLTKKNFFADLHDLGHEIKKNKKSVTCCPSTYLGCNNVTLIFFFSI